MIKKIILPILFISSNLLFSQDYNITYDKQIDFSFLDNALSKNKNLPPEKLKQLKESIKKSSNGNKYVLEFNDTVSKFRIIRSLSSDSESSFEILGKKLFTKGEFYINKKSRKAYNIKETYGEKFKILLDQKKWEILKDTLKIDKFICYKAITHDTIRRSDSNYIMKTIAWFSPELPSYYGPVGYYGLPGLILRIENRNLILTASKIEMKKITNTISIPNKGIEVTEKMFFEISMDASKAYGFKKN